MLESLQDPRTRLSISFALGLLYGTVLPNNPFQPLPLMAASLAVHLTGKATEKDYGTLANGMLATAMGSMVGQMLSKRT